MAQDLKQLVLCFTFKEEFFNPQIFGRSTNHRRTKGKRQKNN